MVTPKTGWLSNGAFLSLSSMCREFIEFFYSHSTRYFPCCFSKTAPVCRCHRSWVYLKATSFFCGLLSRLKRPGRKLDDSVSVVLLCHHDRDVHPLCLLLRCVVVATGRPTFGYSRSYCDCCATSDDIYVCTLRNSGTACYPVFP